MQVFGFTLNLLTLLAIVLSVGLVVDDAIVVVENVERHIRDGKTPLQASLAGARELVGPIIAMTITLAAVYAPIGFQGGLTGSLFREFAFTLAGAVFISGVVALTLSPMMSSRMLSASHHGWLTTVIDRGFDWLRRTYARMLETTLRTRPAVYGVWIALSLAVVPLYMFSPQELAPAEDQGVIFGAIDAPANATVEQLMPYVDTVQRTYASTPEFEQSFQVTFPTGGFGGMLVKPWEERKRNMFAIQEELIAEAQRHHRRARSRVPAVGVAERRHVPGGVRHLVDGAATRRSSPSRRSSCRRRPRAVSSPSRRSPTCASIRRRASS